MNHVRSFFKCYQGALAVGQRRQDQQRQRLQAEQNKKQQLILNPSHDSRNKHANQTSNQANINKKINIASFWRNHVKRSLLIKQPSSLVVNESQERTYFINHHAKKAYVVS